MKSSRYNRVTTVEGTSTRLLFNSRSAALAQVDAESWPKLQALLANPASAHTPEQHELIGQLTYGHYLVPDDLDELEALRTGNRRMRADGKTFFLTIAPTLSCNFACSYCFEGKSTRSHMRMDHRTEQAVLAFAERHLSLADAFMLTWFGGEPTLCMKTIERMHPALAAMAAAGAIKMKTPSIVTNGYLLDGALAARLKRVGIEDAQVTLDGPARIHDMRRPLRHGGPTFDRIVHNLGEAAAHVRIVVRVNVDAGNVEAAGEVLEALDAAGVLPRVQVYFAPVTPSTGSCADMRGRCLTTESFAAEQVRLYGDLFERGFDRVEIPDPSAGSHCAADCENGYVVGPDGLLFRCWEELSLDPATSIGSVFPGAPTAVQRANKARWREWDPFTKSECVSCAVLPLCMGGCPLAGMRQASSTRGDCCSWKHNLTDMLLLRARRENGKEVDP